MSMIDYDARPVTPQIVLVGHRASAVGYSIRDFLSRNAVPYDWVDVDDTERVAGLLTGPETDPDQLPICILPNGMRLAPATLEGVAAGLGMVSAPTLSEYDLTIVGAGPAGLAAAVYAASEGLRVVAIESVAPGGQAGTISMIENYLGFPQGISGSELATRAAAQARRFGAEVLLARRGYRLPGRRTSVFRLTSTLPSLLGLALDSAGYVRTGAGVSSSVGALDGWPLSRQPLPLETNRPGVFAAGDVRSGSIKRCAAAIGEGSMAVALVHQRLAEIGGE